MNTVANMVIGSIHWHWREVFVYSFWQAVRQMSGQGQECECIAIEGLSVTVSLTLSVNDDDTVMVTRKQSV